MHTASAAFVYVKARAAETTAKMDYDFWHAFAARTDPDGLPVESPPESSGYPRRADLRQSVPGFAAFASAKTKSGEAAMTKGDLLNFLLDMRKQARPYEQQLVLDEEQREEALGGGEKGGFARFFKGKFPLSEQQLVGAFRRSRSWDTCGPRCRPPRTLAAPRGRRTARATWS